MPSQKNIQIQFAKKRPSLTVEAGANLMQSLLAGGLPVASSCHGEGICSKCRIKVLAGQEHLSPQTELEKNMRSRLKISDEFRISCQTQVFGDIIVDATYW